MSLPVCLRRWIILPACLMLTVSSRITLGEGVSMELPGRLFTTPGERRLLDELRTADADGANSALQPESRPAPAEDSGDVNGVLMINGFVYRTHGRSTVWINDEPVRVEAPAIRLFPETSGALRLELPAHSISIKLENVPAFPSNE